jgi:GTP-binding protein EngB required for normal cell division
MGYVYMLQLDYDFIVAFSHYVFGPISMLHTKINGPLLPYTNQSIKLPMVLCVGNHSSGKSSFINYVLGRNVQTAGVAPTDDCFTIIAPNDTINPDGSKKDYDQDGFAIIGNPDYGFTSLRQFGPTLQHHTVFKLRSHINSNFIIGTCQVFLSFTSCEPHRKP